MKGKTMEYIYICPKCGLVYRNKSDASNNCSNCHVPTVYSGYDDQAWYAFPKDRRELLKAAIIEPEKEERERKRKEDFENAVIRERELREALPNILISSGFNFDGYRIVKYSGYISGDDAVQIPRSGVFGGNNGQNLTDALVKIRRQALRELKEAAFDLGCNAVIGVDFDYITLEPETANITGGTLYEPYIICVTANGNAVVIEKE